VYYFLQPTSSGYPFPDFRKLSFGNEKNIGKLQILHVINGMVALPYMALQTAFLAHIK
jgi:hypothetical protein